MFQLSFLNGGILAVTAATIIPLLIYLFAKKKPKRVEFSSIRFILASTKKQNRKINLLHILLLILRMLIILLTVLALARPALRSSGLTLSKEHPATGIAIILDTSYSMDYLNGTQSSLERGKQMILEMNRMFSAQDVVVLLTSDANWNRLNGNLQYGRIAPDLLQKINVTYQPASYQDLVQEATVKLAQSQLPNREIYLLTDGQLQPYPKTSEHPLYVIPVVNDIDWSNLSCQKARPDFQLVNRQISNTIQFELVSHGRQKKSDVLCRLVMDGRTIAEKFTDVDANQRKTESIPVQMETSGWHEGYVEIQDGKLLADNRSYFSFYYELRPKIGVVTDLSKLPPMLQSILQVYSGSAQDVRLLRPDNLSQSGLSDISLLVVYRNNALSPRLRSILQEWNNAGKGILFIADRDMAREWQSYLATLFQISWKGYHPGGAAITFLNTYHPVSNLLDGNALRSLEMKDYWDVDVAGKTLSLLGNGNRPFAVVNDHNYLWLFDVASMRNPFFVNGSYPVFGFRTFQYLVNSHFNSASLVVGDGIQARVITLPDGSKLERDDRRYALNQPGIYKVTYTNGREEVLAVNHRYEESSYRHQSVLKGSNIHFLSGKWQNQILQTRYGHELWKYLLMAVLALFAVEMGLVKIGERGSQGTGVSTE